MKRYLFIFLITLAGQIVLAQPEFTLNHGSILQESYHITVPYEWMNGKLIIGISINETPYRFLFDTGAPTAISAKLNEALNLTPIQELALTDSGGKSDNAVLTLLPVLKIGDLTFLDTPVLVLDQPLVFDCFAIDGIVGSNLFRKSIVQIAHASRKIVITSEADRLSLENVESTDLFLTPTQSSPYIWITHQGEKRSVREQVLFDTGMNGFYDMAFDHYKELRKSGAFSRKGRTKGSNAVGLYGAAENARQYRLRISELNLNGVAFKNVTTITGVDSNSKIGSGLLEYGLATIDYPHKKFYFEPFETKEIDLSGKQLPVEFILNDNRLCIGMIWDRELEKIVSVGDQVVSVDEFNFEQMDVCDLISKPLEFKNRDELDLTVRTRTGALRKIRLEIK